MTVGLLAHTIIISKSWIAGHTEIRVKRLSSLTVRWKRDLRCRSLLNACTVSNFVSRDALETVICLNVGSLTVLGEEHAHTFDCDEVSDHALAASRTLDLETVRVRVLANSVGIRTEVIHALAAGRKALAEAFRVDTFASIKLETVLAGEAVSS